MADNVTGNFLCMVMVVLLLASSVARAQTEGGHMPDQKMKEAIALMNDFAERTGLTAGRPTQRYLWTDAFAVCNFLGLAQATGENRYAALALRLIDQVHHTLGQHRDDDPQSGWLSGLSEQEGAIHPTQGGLRIGKALPERGPGEPFDERLEWGRDGQYYHYLTKWMHALDQVTRASGRPQFNLWARELAETAFNAFTYPTEAGRPRRMYWKMSIDLSRPLVPSMGQHDPLDGCITYVQLRSTPAGLSGSEAEPNLTNEIGQLAAMIQGREWVTADPLGIGGLLIDAYRVDGLLRHGISSDEDLLETLLSAALVGLRCYADSGDLRLQAEYRLAFRELGLAIGLHAVELMRQTIDSDAKPSTSEVLAQLKALMKYTPMRDQIESFWREPDHRRASTWTEHRDINEVMLATSLAPGGFLGSDNGVKGLQ